MALTFTWVHHAVFLWQEARWLLRSWSASAVAADGLGGESLGAWPSGYTRDWRIPDAPIPATDQLAADQVRAYAVQLLRVACRMLQWAVRIHAEQRLRTLEMIDWWYLVSLLTSAEWRGLVGSDAADEYASTDEAFVIDAALCTRVAAAFVAAGLPAPASWTLPAAVDAAVAAAAGPHAAPAAAAVSVPAPLARLAAANPSFAQFHDAMACRQSSPRTEAPPADALDAWVLPASAFATVADSLSLARSRLQALVESAGPGPRTFYFEPLERSIRLLANWPVYVLAK